MNHKQLRFLLSLPHPDDENDARVANLLNTTLAWMSVAGLLVVVFYLAFPISMDANIIYPVLVGLFITVFIISLKFFLLNRGYIYQTGWAIVIIVFIALTVSLLFYGSVRDENLTWLFFIIAISGLLLGERGALLFGSLSILYTVILYLLETNGIISDTYIPNVGIHNVVPIVINLTVLLILVYTAVKQTRNSLTQIQQHRQALQNSNAQLQLEIEERKQTEAALRHANQQILYARDTLESKVKERTADLEQANQHLEDLLFAITHDLKEPLRSIEFFSERIAQQIEDKLDSRGKDYLIRVQKASQRQRNPFG